MSSWLYTWDDPQDDFWADEKLAHFFGGAALWFAAALRLPGTPWLWLAIGGLLVEGVELWRYIRWQAAGAPRPWPWLTDKVSLKDLVWDALGGLCAQLLWPFCAVPWWSSC